MNEKEFWKNLVLKMYERIEHDKQIFGDAYTEITYRKDGLLKSIIFSENMENKVVVTDE